MFVTGKKNRDGDDEVREENEIWGTGGRKQNPLERKEVSSQRFKSAIC
jgi:hypothetical protein